MSLDVWSETWAQDSHVIPGATELLHVCVCERERERELELMKLLVEQIPEHFILLLLGFF
jgi:hypothetical protein